MEHGEEEDWMENAAMAQQMIQYSIMLLEEGGSQEPEEKIIKAIKGWRLLLCWLRSRDKWTYNCVW